MCKGKLSATTPKDVAHSWYWTFDLLACDVYYGYCCPVTE